MSKEKVTLSEVAKLAGVSQSAVSRAFTPGSSVSQKTRDRIKYFFEHYKDLEEGKWVKVIGWGDKAEAETILKASLDAMKK